MIIPKSTKDIANAILLDQSFSISSLAREIGVNRSTIYSILYGEIPSPLTDIRLLRLYVRLNQSKKWIH